MDVSIILINYKSCALLLDCINSIVQQTAGNSYEIIVVDNDSQDGAKEKVLTIYPAVVWISMDYNAGFARANNAGIKKATGDYVLILNTDTIILNNAIAKSISLLNDYPTAVGCGIQLLNTDGTTQISGAHFIKGGLNTLLPLPYLGKLVRYLGYTLGSTIPSVQDVKKDVEIDWVVGAYILVNKSVLENRVYLMKIFLCMPKKLSGAAGYENKANWFCLLNLPSYTLVVALAAITIKRQKVKMVKTFGIKKVGK
jgi:GT2 family glycosyltransferase